MLVRELGCSACHADLPPFDVARLGAPALEPGVPRADSVFAYLRRPVAASPGLARMPDFHLDEAEALAVSLFLGGGRGSRALQRARRSHPEANAEAGRRIFVALNCAGCHRSSVAQRPPTAPLLALEGSRVTHSWLGSFLRHPRSIRPFGAPPGSGARMPDFALSAVEADSIAAFLVRRTVAIPGFVPRRLSAFSAAKAHTLLEERFACLGCHALGGRGGRIAPDLAESANRLRPEYLKAMIENPQRLVPGTIMPRTVAPAETIDLIASYLAANELPETARDTARGGYVSLVTYSTTNTARGDTTTYNVYCAGCHGPSGAGDGPNARFLRARPANHADSTAMAARSDDGLYDAISAGGRVLGVSLEMPPFGTVLDPEAIRGLVAYIRTLCRCRGPEWSRDGGRP
ncbi:MAG: cytochrome c [Longimicrobiales bacterium]